MKKYLLILSLLALLGAGCSTEENSGIEGETGFVELRTEISAQVEESTPARADETKATLPANCIPATGTFHLVIKNQEGTEEYLAEYPTFSEYNAPMMPSGDYSATINYGDLTKEGGTAFCYRGTLDFTILARKTIQKSITASLINSAFSLSRNEWFDKYYVDAEFVVRTESNNSFNFTQTTSSLMPIFVKPATKLFLKGTATKAQNGVKVEFPEHEIGLTTARTWHKITIEASQVGQGGIQIKLDDKLTEVKPVDIELNPEA